MLFAYTTSKPPQNQVVQAFANSVGAKVLPVEDFLKNGLPANASGVIFFGLLFGTARILRECSSKSVDFFYIDHAYFLSGYNSPTWMRVTKNGFVQNNFIPSDSGRWNSNFNIPLKEYNHKNKERILILPPSDAVSRTFGAQTWLKTTIRNLRMYTDRPIVVRQKPGPVLNADMTKTISRKKYKYSETLEEQLGKAYCVIAYNSNVAIDALIGGIPVICSKNCAAYPLSNSISNIETLIEYKRLPLLYSLSQGQYNLTEIKNGTAYRSISKLNQVFRK